MILYLHICLLILMNDCFVCSVLFQDKRDFAKAVAAAVDVQTLKSQDALGIEGVLLGTYNKEFKGEENLEKLVDFLHQKFGVNDNFEKWNVAIAKGKCKRIKKY